MLATRCVDGVAACRRRRRRRRHRRTRRAATTASSGEDGQDDGADRRARPGERCCDCARVLGAGDGSCGSGSIATARLRDRLARAAWRRARASSEERDAFKKMVERLTKPVDELDREQLTDFCDARQLDARWTTLDAATAGAGRWRGAVGAHRAPRGRARARGHGERRPRLGGRRCSSGGARSPGCHRAGKVALEGVVARDGKRSLVLQPGLRDPEPEPEPEPAASGQPPVRIRRTSSSESGVTIASTSSPASKTVSPRGITTCSSRTIGDDGGVARARRGP